MIKLATPVQYEQMLEALNALRPLALMDECKTEIIYPVLNMMAADKARPAVGKLARCGRSGSLLKNKSICYDNVETIATTFHALEPDQSITFAQKVFIVFARTVYYNFTAATWWCDPSYAIMFKSVDYDLDVILPFVGRTMYFSSGITGGDVHGIEFNGFY